MNKFQEMMSSQKNLAARIKGCGGEKTTTKWWGGNVEHGHRQLFHKEVKQTAVRTAADAALLFHLPLIIVAN